MIARLTIFAILLLSLASYATSPAKTSGIHANNVACCDGDPVVPFPGK